MQFSPYDWLRHIKDTVTGQLGIMKDADMPLSTAALTGATQTGQALVFDADNEAAQFAMVVPREFDELADMLHLRLGVSYVSGTSITLEVSSVDVWRAGDGENTVDLDVPDPVVINAAFGDDLIEVDLSGGSWKTGDVVLVTVAADNRAGDGIAHVRSAEMAFRSYVVAHDRDRR